VSKKKSENLLMVTVMYRFMYVWTCMYVRNGSKIYCKNYQIFIATTLVQ
jgi:hypothetical protein